ncbi:MAG TPA: serine/threonine-protein kinase [Kofleriaceae bacterium]|nr:serine/threonine-protein kinase [Kofleriaceae bacterium]
MLDQPAAATITEMRASPPSMSGATRLAPNQFLAGRYRIQRFIAGGGMGEVYEARDDVLNEHVALKLLRPELLEKPSAQARFVEEIRLARKITHPNVCRVFDVSIDGDRLFFTMQLHEGSTLAGWLRDRGPAHLDELRPIVTQALAGVAAAHDANVIHADLKPSNLLLTGTGGDRIVVSDFGLAVPCCAELACHCDMAHLLGTPAYMAPEQIGGGCAQEQTDVYAFGVVLFQMVTGTLPFQGTTPHELAQARLAVDAPAPRTLRPDLEPRWNELIRACLARNPCDRPPDARAVARALDLATD